MGRHDELDDLIERCGALSKATWGSGSGNRAVATLQLWAGRPLLVSSDPVGVAAALSWVGAAIETVGPYLSLEDSFTRLRDLAQEIGPPRGDTQTWLFGLLHVATLDELERVNSTPLLLVGIEHAHWLIGSSLARGVELVRGLPDRAALIQLRALYGLDVESAACRVGWSSRQWSYVEVGAKRPIDSGALDQLVSAFGLGAVQRQAIATGAPLTIEHRSAACPWHPEAGVDDTGQVVWPALYGRPTSARWLAGGDQAVVRCIAGGCGRYFGVGDASLFLLPPRDTQLPDAPRARLQAMAHYIGSLQAPLPE